MTLKLNNGFDRLADANLGARGGQIAIAMTDNPNFADPTPSVADFANILAAYGSALGLCTDGDRQKIALKNQKRQALIEALHTWGLFVLLNCKNDAAIAMTSGFQIAKIPSPAPLIPKPLAPVLEAGINTGTMLSKGKRDAQALTYLHQYATQAEMSLFHWQSQPCSKSTCLLENLIPGTLYYFRMVIIGRKDQIVYSDIVSRVAA